ncbi:MAG: DUF2490 domain-containing protein [Polaribacter sp.]
MKVNSLITYFLILMYFVSHAQNLKESNLGSWYMLHSKHQFNSTWSIQTGIQERNFETVSNYNLFLAYLGMNYKINENWTTTFGYGILDIDRVFNDDNSPNVLEHRFYEQFTYSTKYLKTPFSHRFRLEHRNLHFDNSSDFVNRFRYRIQGKLKFSNNFYLKMSNEIFYELNSNSFNENRWYNGLCFALNETVSIETGYLKQHINQLNLNRLQLGLFLSTKAKP